MPHPCPICRMEHEQPVCTICGGAAAEDHHQLGRQLDFITGPRCEADHDGASERQRISGIPLRATGRQRHIVAIRHGFHELHEVLDAMKRHFEALEAGE